MSRPSPTSPSSATPSPTAPARGLLLALVVLLGLGLGLLPETLDAGPAEERARDDEGRSDETPTAEDRLPERYQQWLADVSPLISEKEREIFLQIGENYRRDAFIRRFWKVRDPFPETPHNELRERWTERVETAREWFGDLDNERARLLLFLGEPDRRHDFDCLLLQDDLDIWYYPRGSERVSGFFTLVFVGREAGKRGFFRPWSPREGLRGLLAPGRDFGRSNASQLGQLIAANCRDGNEILSALAQALDSQGLMAGDELFPTPGEEWVASFLERSTELPDDAEMLDADLALSFPGRHQSRTVVQGLVTVARDQLQARELGDYRGYRVLVDGEILRQGELFDQFRYRFDFPAEDTTARIPIVVQRYLRPGPYQLVLKLEDTNAERFYRTELELDVPRVSPDRRLVSVDAEGNVVKVEGEALAALDDPEGDGAAANDDPTNDARPMRFMDEPSPLADRLAADRLAADSLADPLAEANATIATGDQAIRILALPDLLLVGRLRVEARTRGEGIDRVAFELNGRPVMRKSRPPYSVELNLGDEPRIHTLRAIALDAEGEPLAADEVSINAGPHRFDIRLVEPQRGKVYRRSVRVHAEVEVPEGEALDRVELFLDETRVATLYQPPFEQPLLLPEKKKSTSYVRALAFLQNGDVAEDVQFINAPDFVDEVRVNFVELYTSVLDKKGNFVEGLTKEEFSVFEDGKEQQIRRFESMRDLPIRAGLVIDTSLSMADVLQDVERAAYQFLESVMTDRDRAALVTFADEPRLRVRFTGDRQILAGGLVGLDAEGETAFYDAVIFSLHYFSGLKGKRAVVVLTDGEDSMSQYSYEDALGFARRTGVAIYIIGLNMQTNQQDTRSKLIRLARETGGDIFFIDHVRGLERVYDTIQEELRSQYLVAYQSTSQEEGFRELEIRTRTKGLEAKTIRGYHP